MDIPIELEPDNERMLAVLKQYYTKQIPGATNVVQQIANVALERGLKLMINETMSEEEYLRKSADLELRIYGLNGQS